MDIPQQVKDAVSELVERYGDDISFVGHFAQGKCPIENFRAGADLYMFHYPEDLDIGFPLVILFDGKEAISINNRISLELLRSFKY